jgi:hypothetical protein
MIADGIFAKMQTAKAVTIIFLVEKRCNSQLHVKVMIKPKIEHRQSRCDNTLRYERSPHTPQGASLTAVCKGER